MLPGICTKRSWALNISVLCRGRADEGVARWCSLQMFSVYYNSKSMKSARLYAKVEVCGTAGIRYYFFCQCGFSDLSRPQEHDSEEGP